MTVRTTKSADAMPSTTCAANTIRSFTAMLGYQESREKLSPEVKDWADGRGM